MDFELGPPRFNGPHAVQLDWSQSLLRTLSKTLIRPSRFWIERMKKKAIQRNPQKKRQQQGEQPADL